MDRLDQSQKKNGLLGPESFFAWTAWTRVNFCLDRLDQSQFLLGPLGPESFSFKKDFGPSGPSTLPIKFWVTFKKK